MSLKHYIVCLYKFPVLSKIRKKTKTKFVTRSLSNQVHDKKDVPIILQPIGVRLHKDEYHCKSSDKAD